MIDYIDGERFENLADISFGDEDSDIQETSLECPLVYCSTNRIHDFFEKIKGYGKVVDLISHNGDINFSRLDVKGRSQNIRFWYSQNMMYNDTNACPLPIGLERKFWSKTIYGIFGYKHDCISNIKDTHCEKNKLLYVNFHIRTNVAKRQRSFEIFKNERYAVIEIGDKTRDYENYLTNIKESKFVLSPEGRGLDCHRTWEILYTGSIPILERNLYYEYLYGDLPVLLVNNYSEVTEDFLYKEYERIVNSKWNVRKLNFSYWAEIITQNRWSS